VSPALRRLVSEPLVHFVVLGALIFGIDAAMGADSPGERRVSVTAEQRAGLIADWERSQKRPPTATETELLVLRWVDEEILYREGLARGLDRDDARVRDRVVAKMARILREGVVVPEPTDEELRAYFDENRDEFANEQVVDFTHVFVSGDDDAALARANELLASLKAGGDAATMGDTFQGGRRYRKRKLTDLAETFGDEFADGLEAQPDRSWERQRSTFGYHLVRVDGRTAAQAPDFESARDDVAKRWRDAKREEGVAAAIAELRSRWSVDEP